MRVVIDRERCIGAGMCLGIAPDLFSLDEHQKAVADTVADSDRAQAETAVICCPKEAISIED